MKKYTGNNPKRRIARAGHFTEDQLTDFAGTGRYRGSAHHKSRPADYRFDPPTSPRPSKSLCDDKRVIRLEEATRLFKDGIARGMVSIMEQQDGLPKYVWTQDEQGDVYEAKIGYDGRSYHGYRLGEDDRMREWVIDEWKRRDI